MSPARSSRLSGSFPLSRLIAAHKSNCRRKRNWNFRCLRWFVEQLRNPLRFETLELLLLATRLADEFLLLLRYSTNEKANICFDNEP